MHKDHKQKRASILEIQERELRQPKSADPKAIEKLRTKPYQLKYAERMKGQSYE